MGDEAVIEDYRQSTEERGESRYGISGPER